MKSLVISCLLLFALNPSYAQVWNTAGQGLPGNWDSTNTGLSSYHYDKELYVAYSDYNSVTETSSTVVKRWNGTIWQTYPSISDFHVEDIVVDASGIYLAGWNKVESISFYEFDQNSWLPRAPSAYAGRSRKIHKISAGYAIGGNFTAAGGLNNLYIYNGSSYGPFPAISSAVEQINDIITFNGSLFVACKPNGSSGIDGFYKLDGSNWSTPAHFLQGTTTTTDTFNIVVEYQNELYLAEGNSPNSTIFRLGNDSLHFVKRLDHNVIDAKAYNNELYFVGDTGLGPIPFLKTATKYNGVNFISIGNGPKGNMSVDTLNSQLYIFSKWSSILNGITYNHVFRTSSSMLNGFAYIDLNNDCFKNSNEPFIENAQIGISGTENASTVSLASGFYSIGVVPGSYTFSSLMLMDFAYKNFSSQCSMPSPLIIGPGQTFIQNIGFSNTVTVDMSVNITPFRGFRARHGFTESSKISIANTGNSTQPSVSLKVEAPSTYTSVSSPSSPSSVSGNTFTFNFLNVQPQEVRDVYITGTVDFPNHSIGDTVCWTAIFGPVMGDADTTDNSDTVKQIVVAAYDPNDKQVSANRISPTTSKIDYHINFQNTGNDTAYKVTVIDSLDVSLPVTSVMINSASHPYSLSIANNVLIWEFNNIFLPDSGTNFAGSQGYVNFTVNIAAGLVVGDTLRNSAQIYFDYQEGVHTNTAKTVVVIKPPISVRDRAIRPKAISLYPNPNNGELYIENHDDDILELNLIDVQGNIIDVIKMQPYERIKYSASTLPSGLYLLQNKDEGYRLLIR